MKHDLRQRLRGSQLVSAPGVYDMISLKIADRMGFELLSMTGSARSHPLLGVPDAGLATYSDMVGHVGAMDEMAGTPLSADGDTGYGAD
jgi:2-methylisocitrate lyase-like PEP mutase family enzyme